MDTFVSNEHIWLIPKIHCFPATMAMLYSQVIQLCQNCKVHGYYNTRCPGAVVPGVETSEDCYNYINTSSTVEMVRFDKLGICWTYADGTCMEPPPDWWSSISMYNSWTARRSFATGNSTLYLFFFVTVTNKTAAEWF